MNTELIRKYERQCWDFQANCLDAEKFAELIVRECIAEIEFQYGGGAEQSDGTHSKDWDQAIECASAMLQKRFGVEE